MSGGLEAGSRKLKAESMGWVGERNVPGHIVVLVNSGASGVG